MMRRSVIPVSRGCGRVAMGFGSAVLTASNTFFKSAQALAPKKRSPSPQKPTKATKPKPAAKSASKLPLAAAALAADPTPNVASGDPATVPKAAVDATAAEAPVAVVLPYGSDPSPKSVLLPRPRDFRPLPSSRRMVTEYARSSTSQCTSCLEAIPAESLRLGLDMPSDTGEHRMVRWYHPDCFARFASMFEGGIQNILTLEPPAEGAPAAGSEVAAEITTAPTACVHVIRGIGSLKPEDRAFVSKLFGGSVFANAEDEARFEAQRELLVAVDQELSRDKKLLRDIAPAVLQFCVPDGITGAIDGNYDKVATMRDGKKIPYEIVKSIATDALVFGVLPRCPECQSRNGWLLPSDGGYKCQGSIDEFTACTAHFYSFPAGTARTPVADGNILVKRLPKLASLLKAPNAKGVALQGRQLLPATPPNVAYVTMKPITFSKRRLSDVFSAASGGIRILDGRGSVSYKAAFAPEVLAQLEATVAACGGGWIEPDELSTSSDSATNCMTLFVVPPMAASSATELLRSLFTVEPEAANRLLRNQRFLIVTTDFIRVAAEWRRIPAPYELPPNDAEPSAVSPAFIIGRSPNLGDDATRSKRQAAKQRGADESARAGENAATDDAAPPDQNPQQAPSKDDAASSNKGTTKAIAFVGQYPVDPDCAAQFKEPMMVVTMQTKPHRPFAASLVSADVMRNVNKFYIMQLVQSPTTRECFLFRRWGRVGDELRCDRIVTRVENVNSGIRMFETVFFDKTNNHFDEVDKKFIKSPGKMNLIHTDVVSAAEEGPSNPNNSNNTEGAASKAAPGGVVLPTTVRSLMGMLFDTETMTHSMKEMSIDVKKLPVGSLKLEVIDAGRKLLNEVAAVLITKSKTESAQAAKQRSLKLVSLTNRFYSVIPHEFKTGSGTTGAVASQQLLLDNLEKVGEKVRLLDDLSDIVVAQRIRNIASGSMDPCAAQYQSLGVTLQPISEVEFPDEFAQVALYLKNTHGSTHDTFRLQSAWKLERHGEDKIFNPEGLNNRKLLWHGSRLTNWVRILQQGLRIAPPEAPSTGYMFGKGVYFADMFTKSANYCHISSSNSGLLTLAEVALGTPTERRHSDFITELPRGTHSCYAIGSRRPNPTGAQPWVRDPAVEVPLGNEIYHSGAGSLRYNEFIVYNTAQIRLRYLLQVTCE